MYPLESHRCCLEGSSARNRQNVLGSRGCDCSVSLLSQSAEQLLGPEVEEMYLVQNLVVISGEALVADGGGVVATDRAKSGEGQRSCLSDQLQVTEAAGSTHNFVHQELRASTWHDWHNEPSSHCPFLLTLCESSLSSMSTQPCSLLQLLSFLSFLP